MTLTSVVHAQRVSPSAMPRHSASYFFQLMSRLV